MLLSTAQTRSAWPGGLASRAPLLSQSITRHASKRRNIWIRDVFSSQHLRGAGGPNQTTSRIQKKEVLTHIVSCIPFIFWFVLSGHCHRTRPVRRGLRTPPATSAAPSRAVSARTRSRRARSAPAGPRTAARAKSQRAAACVPHIRHPACYTRKVGFSVPGPHAHTNCEPVWCSM